MKIHALCLEKLGNWTQERSATACIIFLVTIGIPTLFGLEWKYLHVRRGGNYAVNTTSGTYIRSPIISSRASKKRMHARIRVSSHYFLLY